jgi:hypothetical protein
MTPGAYLMNRLNRHSRLRGWYERYRHEFVFYCEKFFVRRYYSKSELVREIESEAREASERILRLCGRKMDRDL